MGCVFANTCLTTCSRSLGLAILFHVGLAPGLAIFPGSPSPSSFRQGCRDLERDIKHYNHALTMPPPVASASGTGRGKLLLAFSRARLDFPRPRTPGH